MKFTKKPIVIDAFQMTKERRRDISEWPSWLLMAWHPDVGMLLEDSDDPEGEKLCIKTLEGVLHVSWDDWIIQGVQGEIYPCKPDIFEETYETPSKTGQKIIIWHSKHGDVYVDAATPEKEDRAWLFLFRLINDMGFYCDLEDDEKDAYSGALKGNARAAKWLLDMRADYEYERITNDFLEQP